MSCLNKNFSHRVLYLFPFGLILLFFGCRFNQGLSPEELVEAKAAFESCLVCHSTQEMQRGPIINGLPAWYNRQQLRKFLEGTRGQSPENKSELLMGSARDRISDERTINLLSQYIALLPPKPYQRVVKGNALNGSVLYQSCIPCHGAKGEGNEMLKSPPLNIQEDWYLLDQLRKFASGKRGHHPKDIEGIQMANTLVNLDRESLKDLTAHIQDFSMPTKQGPAEIMTLQTPAKLTSIEGTP